MGKWLDHRRDARRPPPAPTLGDLNHMPGAQFGAFNPNTGAYAPTTGLGRVGTTAVQPMDFSAARSGPTTAATTGTLGTSLAGYAAPQMNNAATRKTPSTVSPVAMAGVQGDSSGMDAARLALSQMQERSQTGWSQLDRMALDQAMRQANLGEQAQRGAVMADAAQRGMRGSGLSMLGALTAQQGGADRALDAATTLGIAGRDRAMANTSGAAALGMGINDTAFNQAAARAAAVDSFNAMASGRADAATAQNYQNQLAQFQLQQQMQQQRMQNIMGPIMGLVGTGISLASGGIAGGGGGGGGSGGGIRNVTPGYAVPTSNIVNPWGS